MVARLNRIKDHRTLIRAVAELRQRSDLPDCELWLVGDGEELDALEALADQLGAGEMVRFLGARAEVPELLGAMDVFAFSVTRDEGFGVALIEAMAAGLPIVASNVPACREVLAEGDAGRLVPGGDPRALADELARLLRSPDERQTWGTRAFERVRKEYDIRPWADRWYGLLVPGVGGRSVCGY